MGSQVAQSYGLLLGTIVMVPKTAQTLAAIIMLTFILTGGYFVRGDHSYMHPLVHLFVCVLKHLHNVEPRFYCPQTFLSLDFQCRDDVSELK